MSSDRCRGYRSAAGAGAAISVLLTATGCMGAGGAETALPGVLEQVRYTVLPPDGVTFVDAERANELVDEDPERFAFVADLGTPLLAGYDLPGNRYGLDPAGAEATVTVGFHDHYGYWVGRFDEDDVTEALEDDGFEREDGLWRDEEAGITFQVSGGQIAWGDEDFTPARLSEGESLADEPAYGEVTDCLGDVYRADFIQGEEGAAIPLYAYGHVADSPEETATVLCVLTDDGGTADEAAGLLRDTIEAHPETYPDAEVTSLDGADGVRVTVPDTAPEQVPGRLLSTDVGLMLTLSQL
ncbi:hypothetical protein [Streptomyces sp. NBC_01803]|uniref:hypothetical protein n=1 Tax=Streptomyces sp. NBC_01803 TaxID=2975946 RepID=UPI002DDAF816|nr:hypothetical protein [Streptomyces sp. NBC_01803]WSA46287.1 hypothetical protein OIE51_20115 [Streptomyces sp. NBC_01803]